MKKGEEIQFLDYTIRNCENNDGIILYKENVEIFSPNEYEYHLGNYNTLEAAQQAAVIHFMIARPNHFATTILYRCMSGAGQYHEYFLFEGIVKRCKLKMPKEITLGNGLNFQIYLNDKPLYWGKK